MPDSPGRGGIARRWLPWLMGLAALTALILAVDVGAVSRAIAQADAARFVPLAVFFVLLWFVIESANLADLLRCFGHRRPFIEVMAARAYTYILLILNYGLGLVGMTLYARSRAGLSTGRASSMMLFYSHVEVIALALLTLAGAAHVGAGDTVIESVAMIAAAYLGFTGLLFWLGRHRRLPARLAGSTVLGCFREAGAATLLRLILGRALYFATFAVFFYFALPSFGLEVPLPVLLATTPAIFIIGNLPVTAAGIGTIQAGMLYFFRDYGPAANILAFSICYSAALILLRLPLGAVVAFKDPSLLVRAGSTAGEQPKAI